MRTEISEGLGAFRNPQRAVEVPFIVFAEYFIEPKNEESKNPEGSKTKITHKYVSSGFAYCIRISTRQCS